MKVLRQNRRRLALLLAIFGCVLAGTGCERPTYTVKVEEQPSFEFQGYRILNSGTQIVNSDGKQELSFDLIGGRFESAESALAGLQVEVLTACGWRKLGHNLSIPSKAAIEQARKEGRNPNIFLSFRTYSNDSKTVWLFFDNRDNGDAKLGIGALEYPVKAGATERLALPWGNGCAEADQLKLNGEVVGKVSQLESGSKPEDGLAQLLLDAKGTHCYNLEWQDYSSSYTAVGKTHGQHLLAPQKIRALQATVDYFMEPLPGSVWSSNSYDSKGSLTPAECGR